MNSHLTTKAQNSWMPILVSVLAIAIFSLMDALMKNVSQQIGSPNAALWRSIMCVPISGLLFLMMRGKMPERSSWKVHVSRAVISAFMVLLFFHGITKVPLAEGVALTFIAPLVAVYLASLFMHEKIQRLALIGSLVGFTGVLIMIAGRARAGSYPADVWLGIAALLATAVLYAANLVLMRKQALMARPVEIVFFQTALVMVLLGVPAPLYGAVPTPDQLLLLAACAVCTVSSLLLLSWAYARAEVQHLAPIEYTAFLWATLFGYLMFRDQVTLPVMAGTVFIVCGCLIATWKRTA